MTYRDLGFANSPTRLRGYFGRRLVGAAMLLLDSVAQGLSHAVKAAWIKGEEGGAYDAPSLLASETSLPRYPLETYSQHKARLERAWLDWPFAGDESSILGQLAAAGFPGAEIRFDPNAPGPNGQPAPYWSQFWVFFPIGSHPIVGAGQEWGSFDWGDGTLWGPEGRDGPEATQLALFTIRSIIKKWKPADWVCRGLMFELSRPKWGEFEWGDGTVWGGVVQVGA
jgi:hypothetical protein